MILKKESSEENVETEPVTTIDQVKEIIEEFEPNEEFRQKSRLSLDGQLTFEEDFSKTKLSFDSKVFDICFYPMIFL